MAPFTKNIKAGRHLFRENDLSRELYLIQSGSVKVYRSAGGKEIELAILEKGAVLGEMALIDGKPRSASVKALCDSSVIIIDAETFHNKVKGIPPWFFSIIKSTCQKIRQANRRLQNISSEHQEAHIIMVTCLYLHRHGANQQGIAINNLQHHLIQLLGATYQTVTGTLDFLCIHQFISIRDNAVFIESVDKLCEYCEYLRFFLRKQFESLDVSDNNIGQLSLLLTEKYSNVLKYETASTSIEGDLFYDFLLSNNLDDNYKDLVDMLDKKGFVTISRKPKTKEKGRTPLGDCTIKLHHLSWKRAFLFFHYNSLSPGTV